MKLNVLELKCDNVLLWTSDRDDLRQALNVGITEIISHTKLFND